MKLFSFLKSKPTIEKKVESKIAIALKEMGALISDHNSVMINPGTMHLIEPLLSVLESNKSDFSFYDPIIYPSPSDPGAYFAYSFEPDENSWKMTFGNHGWSGGIYKIRKDILIRQIESIIRAEKHIELETEKVAFFSHYKPKNDAENDDFNKKLELIYK